jgi:hypothetical protein
MDRGRKGMSRVCNASYILHVCWMIHEPCESRARRGGYTQQLLLLSPLDAPLRLALRARASEEIGLLEDGSEPVLRVRVVSVQNVGACWRRRRRRRRVRRRGGCSTRAMASAGELTPRALARLLLPAASWLAGHRDHLRSSAPFPRRAQIASSRPAQTRRRRRQLRRTRTP